MIKIREITYQIAKIPINSVNHIGEADILAQTLQKIISKDILNDKQINLNFLKHELYCSKLLWNLKKLVILNVSRL